MGNRGSSSRGVGGGRSLGGGMGAASSRGGGSSKQQAKILRKQQQQQQMQNRQANLTTTAASYYPTAAAAAASRSSSNDLLTQQQQNYNNHHHHQSAWRRVQGAPSSSLAAGSQQYLAGPQRATQQARFHHHHPHSQHLHHSAPAHPFAHHHHHSRQGYALDHNEDEDFDPEELESDSYQQLEAEADLELPISGPAAAATAAAYSRHHHHHKQQFNFAGGQRAGSSQTYGSTPLATSSSSSSHSTAQLVVQQQQLADPYEVPSFEEEQDFGLYEGPPYPRAPRHHLSSQQITTPPAQCLDACCNPAPLVTRPPPAPTTRLYSPHAGRRPAAAAATTTNKRNLHTQRPQKTTTTSSMHSNGITQQAAPAEQQVATALERGLALSEPERAKRGLLGLLPAVVQDQELQSRAVMNFLENCQDELGKYVYLRHLKDFNERLFYYTLTRNVERLMPLVYTPTVGLACQKFSEIYMRPRGMWVTARDAGRVKQVVANWPERDVRVIVLTDGERILGLGDLGANGMGISVGKLSLYTALAGIAPANVLPVTLDVGTNNRALLADPFYIGLRQERLRGAEYEQLIEEFMREIVARYGRSCLIQFEDFANSTAFNLLKRHRRDYCTFNDDIQGTASVALAGLFTAVRQTGRRLADCNFLFYGAGEANLGTAQLLIMAMLDEGATRAEAKRRIWLVDSKGLVVSSRKDLNEHKAELAQELATTTAPTSSLEEIIDLVKPLAIVGASAQGGAFTRAILEKMAAYNERPIVFALSNPTSKAECTAAQAYEWTRGRCVFASGSPFEPVVWEGKTYITGQGNNAYIFPGVGLAAIGAHTHVIPEETFLVAARALSDQVTQADLEVGLVYPSLATIREVTLRVATRVLEFFYAERLATYRPEPSDKRAFLEAIQYDPRY